MASPVESDQTIRVGCVGLPDGIRRDRYFSNLDYAELASTFYVLPKQKVLNRWGENDQRFGVTAWQAITHPPSGGGYPRCNQTFDAQTLSEAGSYRNTAFVTSAVDKLANAATTAGAEVVLFRTPPMWTPSASNQQQLRVFFTEIASAERFGDCQRVWHPDGLWETEQAATLAAELGIVMACDPLPQDPLAPPLEFFAELAQRFDGRGYFRLSGLGQSRKLNEYNREQLLDLADQFQTAWLVFDTPSKYHDARSVRKELKQRLALLG